MKPTRTIEVGQLARVEGEGALRIRVDEGEVCEVELRVYEPPRFFESFLRGRSHLEPPDLTARICGICPVAYQMSACLAIEDALGVEPPEPVRELRRLLYAGEWIESHALHMFFLHAPDFLGFDDALAMAKEHPATVRAALRIKKAGNAIVRVVGGREIHPVNVRVGGFYRAPRREELDRLVPDLEAARAEMDDALDWMAELEFPDVETDVEHVTVRSPGAYPVLGDGFVSNRGIDAPASDFETIFEEAQVARSTALHARVRDRGNYLCGALARFSLHAERLSPGAREAARRIGLEPPVRNPFRSLLVRGVETVHAFDEALRVIAGYEPPDPPAVSVEPRAGVGHGCTEAPRGMLYHRYEIDDAGTILSARIVPPTSQNQASIEDDLRRSAARIVALPDADAALLAERMIRNHDPCISCATHFLTLEIEGAAR